MNTRARTHDIRHRNAERTFTAARYTKMLYYRRLNSITIRTEISPLASRSLWDFSSRRITCLPTYLPTYIKKNGRSIVLLWYRRGDDDVDRRCYYRVCVYDDTWQQRRVIIRESSKPGYARVISTRCFPISMKKDTARCNWRFTTVLPKGVTEIQTFYSV